MNVGVLLVWVFSLRGENIAFVGFFFPLFFSFSKTNQQWPTKFHFSFSCETFPSCRFLVEVLCFKERKKREKKNNKKEQVFYNLRLPIYIRCCILSLQHMIKYQDMERKPTESNFKKIFSQVHSPKMYRWNTSKMFFKEIAEKFNRLEGTYTIQFLNDCGTSPGEQELFLKKSLLIRLTWNFVCIVCLHPNIMNKKQFLVVIIT